MAKHRSGANKVVPTFSVIIPVHNDWEALGACLESLANQLNPPSFEVIVVDDGSIEDAPESIRRWSSSYPLTIIIQAHAGISTARNRGIQACNGSLLLFVDADSRLRTDSLAMLHAKIMESPNDSCFQLHLIGDRKTLVGKAEDIRLETIQHHTLQMDGRIRYLNTAGFSIRRSKVNLERQPFDAAARRGEDTLLLATMLMAGECPVFVDRALVRHEIALSPLQCLIKVVRSALLVASTYKRIHRMGIRIRVSHWHRMKMLFWMWAFSGQPSLGRSAWAFAVARQILCRVACATATLLNL